MTRRLQIQVLVIALGVLASLALLIWTLSSRYNVHRTLTLSGPSPETRRLGPSIEDNTSASVTPNPIGQEKPDLAERQPVSVSSPTAESIPLPQTGPADSAALMIPVAGVRPEQLQDTYNQARSEGRVHNAIDIMAPKGTPVVAAADGPIHKIFYSERGGNTIYQLSTDGKTVYYYAHLDGYAQTCVPGRFARRGEVIGYVGDTGNAGAGNYHLHFAISIITDPKRLHDGVPVNPYPLLGGRAR